MSHMDATLQYLLFTIILPIILLGLFCRYVLGIRWRTMRLKLEALIFYHTCGLLHSRVCSNEKTLLFRSMVEIKKKLRVKHLDVLEIGIGSGQNFSHYPEGTKVTALDPNPNHEHYLLKNLHSSKNHITFKGFVRAFGENMSQIADESFDAVVCTLTLCSVRDPEAVLQEVQRVLKKDGVFFYLEHVAGENGSFIRSIQNYLQLIWPYFTGGCNINRETWTYLDQSHFRDVQYRHYSANIWLAFFFRPFIYGTATKV